MEHQVTVPFMLDDVHHALADPALVRRCVPGIQLDAAEGQGAEDRGAEEQGDQDGDRVPTIDAAAEAGAREVSGRLRLRIGNSTITYRGVLRLTTSGGEYRVELEGNEARGTWPGTLHASLVVRPEKADGATILRMTGHADVGGRLEQAGPKAAEAAGKRLLDRFAAELVTELSTRAPNEAADTYETLETTASAERTAKEEARTEAQDEAGDTVDDKAGDTTGDEDKARGGYAVEEGTAADAGGEYVQEQEEAEAKPSDEAPDVLGSASEESPAVQFGFEPGAGAGSASESADLPKMDEDPLTAPVSPAVGRRTMIGRSAEEVDHAPPRGRYAPEPAPGSGRTQEVLRWVGPVAAGLVASAVIVRRILRRR